MRKLITFCWFSIVSLNLVWAQLVPQDVQFRLDQIKYIKETVQPVIVTPLPSYINTPYSEFRGELLPDSTFIYPPSPLWKEPDTVHSLAHTD